MENGQKLRRLLEAGEFVVAPGAYDGYSVQLIERAGFSAAYMTGNGCAAVHGKPDANYLTLSEVTQAARTIAQSSNLPIIADADTGFGGLFNVARCVRDFEEAGIAAIHLEDQPFPKRCPAFVKSTLISTQDMCNRIDVALNARKSGNFVIIARTDIDLESSFEAGIERANAYHAAGADAIFVNGLRTAEQARRIGAEVKGILLYNYRGSDLGPKLSQNEIKDFGFKILTYSLHGLRLMAKAYFDMLSTLRESGDIRPWLPKMISWEMHEQLTGVPEYLAFERKYISGNSGS
jgi:2-methylisocitrate lyase-like PEP mutase family enzyme